ncbi:exocyst complex component 7-like [Artemia franciscana]|uniref:Exocyst complex component 7 n=1 Tax=Artemia franciscana TaxID=6661 RepID=A0AA88L7F5_ARTSF|nr:hypothetical protein QYM36_012129 [Artemia franciscana]KAK2710836.1 hypothetical protein QYM36_012129 [Artemia franciscana]
MSASAFVNEAIKKNMDLSSKIESAMDSFGKALDGLESIVMPVFHEAESLQRRKENLEKTVKALEDVLGYYYVSRDLDSVIKDRPLNIGVDRYLAALERLKSASQFFIRNSPESKELENVICLLEFGIVTLNDEFKDIVSRNSKPLLPVNVTDLISGDVDSEKMVSLDFLPVDKREVLSKIADWLLLEDKDEFMNIYATFRSSALTKSLTALRDYHRSLSLGSSGASPSVASPTLRPKLLGKYTDTPSRKTSKKISSMIERTANKMLVKASQTIEQSTRLGIVNKRGGAIDSKEDCLDEVEVFWLVTAVEAFVKLLQIELKHMIGIIHLKHFKWVLSIIMKESLDLIVNDAEVLAAKSKRLIVKNEFSSLLSMLLVLKNLQLMKKDLDELFDGCSSQVRTKYSSFVNLYCEVSHNGLMTFLEYVRSGSGASLPKDGTVFEVTSNVLIFLEQLLHYVDAVGILLSKDEEYKTAWNLGRSKEEKCKECFGLYLKKAFSLLNLNLSVKSEEYSDACIKAVFRLNNFHHITKVLVRSGLLELLKRASSNCEDDYRTLIEKQKKMYFQCWLKVLNPITQEDLSPVVLDSGKLRDKDRNLIKEKFLAFNKEFEDLSQSQRGYSVPDMELRESLKRDNKEKVLPLYQDFYDNYSAVSFTKNVEKYIRYSPAQVSSQIDTFFDVTA